MLKDVRGRIAEYAERSVRKQPTIADLEAEGTLYVQLLKATNLLAADANGLSDPYCKLMLGDQKQRSRKLYKTLEPVWNNEVFAFAGCLGQLVAEPLQLTMYDFDILSSDDKLGEVQIELADHTYCNEIRRDLTACLDTQGEVYIQVIPEKFQTLKGCCASMCFPVIRPESRFRSGWNVALAFFILYCGIAVPLEIAFEPDMVKAFCTVPHDPYGPLTLRHECLPYLLWFWLNFFVDIFFIIDIVINFRTGYMHEGHFVNDDWMVMSAYLKESFIMDVASTIPLGIIQMLASPDNPYGDEQITQMQIAAEQAAGGSSENSAQTARMLRLLRLAKLTKLARMRKLAKLAESFEEYINPGVLAVSKLVFISLFCCHLFGCLWWMISDLEIAEELAGTMSPDSWFSTPYTSGPNEWHPPHWLKNEASLTMKYMHAFFWGAGMVTSLVPREVDPTTVVEYIVTCAVMFFGLMLNAYVISSLSQAMAAMNAKAEFTGKQMESIKSYLTIKQVPKALKGRIMEYYHYLFGSNMALENLDLFRQLPPALVMQLNLATNRRLAMNCAFFHKVSNESLVELLGHFTAVVFIPSQQIARQVITFDACNHVL
ncbi:cyclic nucleotide-binding protein [Chrysochromulina tobinii]|uniref:Cyclic nucleotide-binding protein n=1 Tax=Chrysochromulina tobinii TaxID=1460289 RepID=A0A0M0K533_9EUKA|nr:cyclic nucleotide-binding protein [Chrysochromulina tobinii]|eukprot:KOO33946.1 cyclic nucleotide-binding protein [Chrysochromulina sp. CCMP291]